MASVPGITGSFMPARANLASALARRGVKRGDTVSVMLANTPAMIEAHYGVPMAGAVLNTLNTRLDAAILGFTLDHAETKVLIVDREFSKVMKEALARQGEAAHHRLRRPGIYRRRRAPRRSRIRGFAARRRCEAFAWLMPGDEWDAISLNYTSGTTGDPKGVVYHHRGAYLLALGNVVTCGMGKHPVYLVDAADVPLQRLVLSLDAVDRRRHACVPARGARRADLRRHRHA
jgi:fatty-acyl-CoA synthase